MQSTFLFTKSNDVMPLAYWQAWEATRSAPPRFWVLIAELWLDWSQDNHPNSSGFLLTPTPPLWSIQCYQLARRTDGTKRSTGCRVAIDSHCGAARLPVVSAFSEGSRAAACGGRSRDSCRRSDSSER